MPSKPQWLAVAILMPDNKCEHGHILDMYIDTTLALMEDGHEPPVETFKSFL